MADSSQLDSSQANSSQADSSDALSQLTVSTPCDVKWDSMSGDGATRFCEVCLLTVHNISAMTKADAARLIKQQDSQLCARFFRRPDGTIVTSDSADASSKDGNTASGKPFKHRPALYRPVQYSLAKMLSLMLILCSLLAVVRLIPAAWYERVAEWAGGGAAVEYVGRIDRSRLQLPAAPPGQELMDTIPGDEWIED